MEKNKTTIHDISKALKINSSTVSRALSNSPRVKQKTKDLVNQKAKELGYQKNALASNLRTNKTNTIGVVVPRISRKFFSTLISGIEQKAYEEGYSIIICQSLDKIEREQKIIDTLISNQVDGLLISTSMETTNYDHLQKFINTNKPLVFFDRPCISIPNTINVTINNEEASYKAVQHLIKTGCKHICLLVGSLDIDLYKQRKKGYIKALKEHNLEINPNYILESELSKEDGVKAAQKIINMPEIDAVYSVNDTAAISAMQYLKQQNIKIPKDISFIGFNNDPISEIIEPSLSSTEQPDYEMGILSAKILIQSIKDKNFVPDKKNITLEQKLILRNSTKKIKR